MSWLWLLLALPSQLTGQILPSDPLDSLMSPLLHHLLQQMPPCLLVVDSSNQEPMAALPLEDKVFLRTQHVLSAIQPLLHAAFAANCKGYLVQTDDPYGFLNHFGSVRVSAKERHIPKMAFLPVATGPYRQQVFSHTEAAYISDLLVIEILENSTSETGLQVSLRTSDFLSRHIDGLSLGTWTPDTTMSLFPDKLKDLMGKEMKVATFNYPPYSLLEPAVDGNEVRLTQEFCRKHNCTVSIVTDDYMWGQIFTNGSGVGISGNVYTDRADMGLGAIYLWDEEYTHLDYSKAYLMTTITCLVPPPSRLAEWRIPVLPFTATMWLIQVTSVVFASVVLFIVNRAAKKLYTVRTSLQGEFATPGGTLLRTLGMSVLQPPPSRLPRGSPLRSFFTVFEVLFLFFTTIYSGALSSVLTVPLYYPPIDNPMAMFKSGIRWAANHEAWVFSLRAATEPHLQGLMSRFEIHETDTLVELSKRPDYGFTIEVMEGGHVTQTDYLSGEMILAHHVMKKELYTAFCATYLRKGSPYTDVLNRLLGHCIECGLLRLWETDVTLTYLSSRLQTALKISESVRIDVKDPTVLKLNHVQGAFILLAMGMCLSVIVFIGEHLFKIKLGASNMSIKKEKK